MRKCKRLWLLCIALFLLSDATGRAEDEYDWISNSIATQLQNPDNSSGAQSFISGADGLGFSVVSTQAGSDLLPQEGQSAPVQLSVSVGPYSSNVLLSGSAGAQSELGGNVQDSDELVSQSQVSSSSSDDASFVHSPGFVLSSPQVAGAVFMPDSLTPVSSGGLVSVADAQSFQRRDGSRIQAAPIQYASVTQLHDLDQPSGESKLSNLLVTNYQARPDGSSMAQSQSSESGLLSTPQANYGAQYLTAKWYSSQGLGQNLNTSVSVPQVNSVFYTTSDLNAQGNVASGSTIVGSSQGTNAWQQAGQYQSAIQSGQSQAAQLNQYSKPNLYGNVGLSQGVSSSHGSFNFLLPSGVKTSSSSASASNVASSSASASNVASSSSSEVSQSSDGYSSSQGLNRYGLQSILSQKVSGSGLTVGQQSTSSKATSSGSSTGTSPSSTGYVSSRGLFSSSGGVQRGLSQTAQQGFTSGLTVGQQTSGSQVTSSDASASRSVSQSLSSTGYGSSWIPLSPQRSLSPYGSMPRPGTYTPGHLNFLLPSGVKTSSVAPSSSSAISQSSSGYGSAQELSSSSGGVQSGLSQTAQLDSASWRPVSFYGGEQRPATYMQGSLNLLQPSGVKTSSSSSSSVASSSSSSSSVASSCSSEISQSSTGYGSSQGLFSSSGGVQSGLSQTAQQGLTSGLTVGQQTSGSQVTSSDAASTSKSVSQSLSSTGSSWSPLSPYGSMLRPGTYKQGDFNFLQPSGVKTSSVAPSSSSAISQSSTGYGSSQGLFSSPGGVQSGLSQTAQQGLTSGLTVGQQTSGSQVISSDAASTSKSVSQSLSSTGSSWSPLSPYGSTLRPGTYKQGDFNFLQPSGVKTSSVAPSSSSAIFQSLTGYGSSQGLFSSSGGVQSGLSQSAQQGSTSGLMVGQQTSGSQVKSSDAASTPKSVSQSLSSTGSSWSPLSPYGSMLRPGTYTQLGSSSSLTVGQQTSGSQVKSSDTAFTSKSVSQSLSSTGSSWSPLSYDGMLKPGIYTRGPFNFLQPSGVKTSSVAPSSSSAISQSLTGYGSSQGLFSSPGGIQSGLSQSAQQGSTSGLMVGQQTSGSQVKSSDAASTSRNVSQSLSSTGYGSSQGLSSRSGCVQSILSPTLQLGSTSGLTVGQQTSGSQVTSSDAASSKSVPQSLNSTGYGSSWIPLSPQRSLSPYGSMQRQGTQTQGNFNFLLPSGQQSTSSKATLSGSSTGASQSSTGYGLAQGHLQENFNLMPSSGMSVASSGSSASSVSSSRSTEASQSKSSSAFQGFSSYNQLQSQGAQSQRDFSQLGAASSSAVKQPSCASSAASTGSSSSDVLTSVSSGSQSQGSSGSSFTKRVEPYSGYPLGFKKTFGLV